MNHKAHQIHFDPIKNGNNSKKSANEIEMLNFFPPYLVAPILFSGFRCLDNNNVQMK